MPVKEENMLRTRLCDLLGIDVPIILAGMGAGATSAEFAAVVSNQGGLGSVGSLFRATDAVKRDIDLLSSRAALPSSTRWSAILSSARSSAKSQRWVMRSKANRSA